MVDRPAPGAGADTLSAELIENRAFTTSRRGFDQDEVKNFLKLVSDAVRSLHERMEQLQIELTEAEYKIANPRLDEDTLLRLVGEETGAILRSARSAANEMGTAAERRAEELREAVEAECNQIREMVEHEVGGIRAGAEEDAKALREAAETETSELRGRTETETTELRERVESETTQLRERAEEESARVVDEARQAAGDLRTEAEGALGKATEEAEQAATRIRNTATEEAERVLTRARAEAEAVRAHAEHDRDLVVAAATELRDKILGDLTRRRRVASTQVEQLRAGRERLLESYVIVRRTLEEVNEELRQADEEAREAASAAGEVHDERMGEDEVAPDLLAAVPLPAGLMPGRAPADDDALESESGDAESESGDAESESGDAESESDAETESGEESMSGESEEREGDAPRADTPSAGASKVAGRRSRTPKDAKAAKDDDSAERAQAGQSVETSDSAESVASRDFVEPGKPESVEDGAWAGTGVDDLFARLRADRGDGATKARDVAEAVVAAGPTAAGPTGAAGPAEAKDEPGAERAEPAASGRRADDLEPVRSDEEEAWLQRRDQAIGSIEVALARKLKRAMQDEQNDLLDRLRSLRGKATPDTLLPTVEEQEGRFSRAAVGLVGQSAQAGVAFALGVLSELGQQAGPPGTPPPTNEVGDELAAAIVAPLRHRLAETIEQNADDDQAVLTEALGGAYREWKTQRIERITGDALTHAFAEGVLHATPSAVALRWVVDDVDGSCSDCDDNVLAGALPRGEAFPTGQFHPPAHGGCRCIIVPTL